eukprot:6479025-Amphidinium_carterae.2
MTRVLSLQVDVRVNMHVMPAIPRLKPSTTNECQRHSNAPSDCTLIIRLTMKKTETNRFCSLLLYPRLVMLMTRTRGEVSELYFQKQMCRILLISAVAMQHKASKARIAAPLR